MPGKSKRPQSPIGTLCTPRSCPDSIAGLRAGVGRWASGLWRRTSERRLRASPLGLVRNRILVWNDFIPNRREAVVRNLLIFRHTEKAGSSLRSECQNSGKAEEGQSPRSDARRLKPDARSYASRTAGISSSFFLVPWPPEMRGRRISTRRPPSARLNAATLPP